MQPLRAAGNLRLDGKEWKHMVQKFLAQDCSSDLSAPVHFWHCPSCLRSLRHLLCSDQPECLWLTFAMELLALTLTGTHVKTIGIFTDSWKIDFIDQRITLCSSLVSNMCIDKCFPSSIVTRVLLTPLLSKVRATCHARTAAIVIHKPWAHIHWIWIIPWGTSGVKSVGTVYLFLCLSFKKKWKCCCAALRRVTQRNSTNYPYFSLLWSSCQSEC